MYRLLFIINDFIFICFLKYQTSHPIINLGSDMVCATTEDMECGMWGDA
jgi:hypothetical protein